MSDKAGQSSASNEKESKESEDKEDLDDKEDELQDAEKDILDYNRELEGNEVSSSSSFLACIQIFFSIILNKIFTLFHIMHSLSGLCVFITKDCYCWLNIH